MSASRRTLASLAGLLCLTGACRHPTESDCVRPPCPLPFAIMLTATSAAGGPVAGLTLTFSGAAVGSGQCLADQSVTSCLVPGYPGTYNLKLVAPAFEDKTLNVKVTGTTPACGCSSVATQHVNVVLTPRSLAQAIPHTGATVPNRDNPASRQAARNAVATTESALISRALCRPMPRRDRECLAQGKR